MRTILGASALLFLCSGCEAQDFNNSLPTAPQASELTHPKGKTIDARFTPPEGYQRKAVDENSYPAYLRKLPLKAHGTPVLYYDGRAKTNDAVYVAVLDMDIGSRDLQQCADAVMRLRAEYLFATGKADRIHFNLTNGFRADFSKWMQGYRIAVKGQETHWVKSAQASREYNTLRGYLDFVYAYAGSLSLSRELKAVAWEDMQPGDILIIGGSPGHAETVMDIAQDTRGRKVFLLSQSYMPAQDIQILENPSKPEMSPWYELRKSPYTVQTSEYDFSTADLKRWVAD